MVSRNRGGFSTEEERVSDMLVFTTMCIIGHNVDVFVKDGSIFSGTFYTCSLQQDYCKTFFKINGFQFICFFWIYMKFILNLTMNFGWISTDCSSFSGVPIFFSSTDWYASWV